MLHDAALSFRCVLSCILRQLVQSVSAGLCIFWAASKIIMQYLFVGHGIRSPSRFS